MSREAEQPVWPTAFAVRRDWPDGTHEFLALCPTPEYAAGFVEGALGIWRAGPSARSTRYAVVTISVRDFELHSNRRACQSPDCPTTIDALAY